VGRWAHLEQTRPFPPLPPPALPSARDMTVSAFAIINAFKPLPWYVSAFAYRLRPVPPGVYVLSSTGFTKPQAGVGRRRKEKAA